ncbi:MAG TPA: hypothetical protein VK787_01365 [Puia sp.]|jgi:hypothetical protein|nr:hypothetical protein [Puia sp.]
MKMWECEEDDRWPLEVGRKIVVNLEFKTLNSSKADERIATQECPTGVTDAGIKKQIENLKITQWLNIKYFNLQIIIHFSLFIFDGY